MMNAVRFNELPATVQEEVKRTLKAYNKTAVWFEYGEYHVETGACLRASYGADMEYIGEYEAKDIFTEAERIENYINEFNSYPPQYKGRKDWGLIQKMTKERELVTLADGNTGVAIWQGKLNENGDFELTHKIVC